MASNDDFPPLSAWSTGFAGRCPRCGEGHMFKNFLDIAPRCEVCDLDLSFADAGDGPAIFVMMFAGFIVVGAALYVELTYEPAWWIHAVISLPLTLIVCLGMLRPLKGVLVALQYQNKAEQGRLEK